MRDERPRARLLKRFPLSREGMLWFVLSAGMLVTGLFKGINLITLLACWMVTIVFLNYWWARSQLRFLTARRVFPEAPFAGAPFAILVQVHNSGRRAALGVKVQDAGQELGAPRFLPDVAAQATVTLRVAMEVPQRGLYRLPPLELATGHPLALVQLRKAMSALDDLVVFPSLGTLHRGRLRRFLAQHSPTQGQARAYPRRQAGAQTEFHGLRPFRAGDSLRWVHWRTTARRGELMIREFEDMPSDHLTVLVDPGESENPLLERLLSLAATIIWEWCRQKGERLALAIDGPAPAVLVGVTGQETAVAMLERLALTNGGSSPGPSALVDLLLDAELPPGPAVVLTTAATGLAAAVGQALHRTVAQIDVSREEEKEFFE
jgi:uncharacterized protein (DUF58 family)